jgi:hypothetical protein
MMKKLLVLFIVLATTSAAYAVPTDIIELMISSLNETPIEPTKEITVGYSDWVNFDIVFTQTGAMNLMSLDAEMGILAGIGTLDMSQPTWQKDEGFNTITPIVPGQLYKLTTASFMLGLAGGYPPMVDHLLVHCDEDDPPNDIIIDIWANFAMGGTIYSDGATPYDGSWGPPIVVHNVPEPMTIALLGLGSLVLLRRRK